MDSHQFSSVVLLLKQLYGGTQSFQRILPLDGVTNESFQQQLIEEILLSDHFSRFPPSIERRRAFWRWVIQILEREEEEIDERIYNAYVALLPGSSRTLVGVGPPSPCYITRFWRENPSTNGTVHQTTLLESQTTIESGTTGLRTWSASLALADWLITHPEIVQNRNVLELGSGAGFLGLIMAQLQLNSQSQNSITSLKLSDVNSEVLQRCHQNFFLPCNNMNQHPNLKFVLLDWSDAQDQTFLNDPYSTLNETLQDVDVIIGADLVYDTHIIPALAAILKQFFCVTEKEDKIAVLALTIRREETVNAFVRNLTGNSLVCEEIDTTHRANQFSLEMDDLERKLFRIQRTPQLE